MIFILLLVLRQCWIREKGSRHSSFSSPDVRSEEVTTTLFRSDREAHGIAGTAALDRGIPFAFRAVHNECELTPIPTTPALVTMKIW
jgi:hypothetical protein